MFFDDALVAGLVEEDRWVVAVVDDTVTHELDACLPLATLGIAFCVTRAHRDEEADAVSGFHVLLAGSDVHPADEVGVIGDHEAVGEVGNPGWDIGAECGPLVGGARGIAVDLENAAVEIDHAIAEGGLAESGAGGDGVG